MKTKENPGTKSQSRQTESLADLPLTTGQADETKGGSAQRGGAGDDVLIGGIGNDWLSGGTGRDR